MVDEEVLKNYIREHVNMLPTSNTTVVSVVDSAYRAGALLKAVAFLTDYKRYLINEKIKAKSCLAMTTAKLFSAMKTGEKVPVKEKEVLIEANPDYIRDYELVHTLDNNVDWIDGVIKMFYEGQVLLRLLAKE